MKIHPRRQSDGGFCTRFSHLALASIVGAGFPLPFHASRIAGSKP